MSSVGRVPNEIRNDLMENDKNNNNKVGDNWNMVGYTNKNKEIYTDSKIFAT